MHNLAKLLGKSALVVKAVHVDENADCQVTIVGRKAGLISWVLSLLGIDSTFTLRVFRDRLESIEGSLSGRIKSVIPLSALDTYTSGFTKPVLYLLFGCVFAILAIVYLGAKSRYDSSFPFVFLLVLSAVFFVAYFLRKCLILTFTTCGANGIFFLFKRSVVEGISVDEEFAERVSDLVKRNYIMQTRA